MKTNDFRQMTPVQLFGKLRELRRALAVKKFHVATGQDKNASVISTTKKDIARIQTVIRENELSASNQAA